ncbi:hypothetical protein PQX77_014965 [Marasmius sp. AFHP31]|nr:hypothetical protein PQX77_014965 [Marasmius sp. AFHP31]
MSLRNIFEHFRNALFQFYDVNPYPNDLTFKVGDRCLILSLPFDQFNETLFGLLFQHFFLSCHHEVYFCKFHFHINLPLAARKYVNTIAKGITRVGFLTMKTAFISRAVQAWIDAVVFAAEAPAPPTLGYEELRFFTFTPQMGQWLSRTPLAYSPLVCDLYYLDCLWQDAAWRYSDSEVDVPPVIPCQHISLYWGFVACFDIRQAPIYFYHDLLSDNPPYEAQAIIDMVAEAIARVGFLHSHTVFLPGTVNAWIDSVIGCMEDPPPSKLEPQRLFFFKYHPLMGRWVTCPFYHYNPIVHEEFYLNELNRAESPSVWDYQREDSELDNYFRWDEVAINNMWE